MKSLAAFNKFSLFILICPLNNPAFIPNVVDVDFIISRINFNVAVETSSILFLALVKRFASLLIYNKISLEKEAKGDSI